MSFFVLLLSGLVQAITEFLPVSSSGHLSLLQFFFQTKNGFYIDIFFNTATLISVIIFFKSQSIKLKKYLPYIFISTLPLVIFSLIFKNSLDILFSDHHYLPVSFLITSLFLFLSKTSSKNEKKINFKIALLIGLFQVIAVIPGVSRSAITISAGILLGLPPLESFYYSFLLYIPVSLGALALFLTSTTLSQTYISSIHIISFIATSIIGFICLKITKKTINLNNFWKFGFYTLVLSILTLLVIH